MSTLDDGKKKNQHKQRWEQEKSVGKDADLEFHAWSNLKEWLESIPEGGGSLTVLNEKGEEVALDNDLGKEKTNTEK